ncbi:zinc ribbon domain-containing protein [Anaeromyxobacter oryzae]|uniref:zinc ribbon domain-containing protein n=1 Tax=Anaeromyxobacter oryzae TaxID=2918170 RepID=UPI00298BDD8F|nr:zinc ribbon domain-containing protein [Anaeromyxobacter oryzae]
MDPTPILRLLGLGAASGTRGALTLLGVGLTARLLDLPLGAGWTFLERPAVLGALAALALAEAILERDDDLQDLAALALAGVRAASGGVAAAASADRLPPWLAGALGVALALGTDLARRRLHAALKLVRTEVADPRRWLVRLENGGALGVAVAALAAPVVALGAVVVAATVAVAVNRAAHAAEALRRRPCPACGAAIRVEASGCPRCGANVPVERRIGGGAGGVLRGR